MGDEQYGYRRLGLLADFLDVSQYAFLNQETGERKTAPRWEVSLAGSAIICTLRSESTVTSFQESTAQLARSLETVVLATHRRVVAQPGRIELR